MITIGEDMNVIILDGGQVELIQEGERILHVYIIVGNAVHDEETNVGLKGTHVADGGILIASRVMLGGMHISFRID